MTSTLYIDGIDAYSRFGVFPTNGALRAIVGLPSSKTPDYNDWQEEDGIEADLSDGLRLESRDISLALACTEFTDGYAELLDLLSDGQEHTFEFRNIGRTYRWRWTDSPSAMTHLRDLATFTLRFREDDPTQYLPPTLLTAYPHSRYCDEYEIDGVPVSELGFSILKGSRDDFYKHSSIKAPLVRTFASRNGNIVDTNAEVRFKSREVKLKCFMHQPIERLWHNFDSLIYRLIQPEERRIDACYMGEIFSCYYKSCTVDAFAPEGDKAWMQFTLTFVDILGSRVSTDTLLATEDDLWIILEDEPEETTRGYIMLGKNQ